MKTYIIDIDGTLANIEHRLHFINREREGGPDWDAFFAACTEDKPIQNVIDVVRCLARDANLVFLTGRSDSVRAQTQNWLAENGFGHGNEVVMRTHGDHRPDTIAKRELMDRLLSEGKQIAGVFEDRPSVCRTWREMGLTVFQVGSGEEF